MTALIVISVIIAYLIIGLVAWAVAAKIDKEALCIGEDDWEIGLLFLIFWPFATVAVVGWGLAKIARFLAMKVYALL